VEEIKNTYTLNTLYFYVTPECNLSCRHCWIAPRFQNVRVADEYLPFSLFTSIIDQARPLGLRAIKLTGGEPLLHPDILEMISFAQARDLEIIVETNGTLVTDQFAESLAKCRRRFVSVSLDGADSRTHDEIRGRRGSFDETVTGIRTLVGAGIRPQIIMSLFRQNKDQIGPLVRIAEELGAGSVKINIIQPTARGLTVHSEGDTPPISEIIRIGEWMQNTLSRESKIRVIFSIPPAFRALSSLFGTGGMGFGRCNIKNIIGVLGNGSYALCGIGETMPEMIFGHAATDSLEKIWTTNPVIIAIREGLPLKLKGICGECVMNSMCRGSCLALNYCENHDLWAPYWFCRKASVEGMFPPTRICQR
jgi:SynChlorMet cassette radical SAM/SPASM protein ScmF